MGRGVGKVKEAARAPTRTYIRTYIMCVYSGNNLEIKEKEEALK